MLMRDLTSQRRVAPPSSVGHVKPGRSQSSIRTATISDLKFIDALQRKFSNHLGFLPREALVEYVNSGLVTLVEENGEPAGYLAARRRLRSQKWLRPITQAAVCLDAQRRHLGIALVDHVAAVAYGDLLEGLQLWIADDLQEVSFFTAAGFVIVGKREPQNARQRRLLLMRKSLNPWIHGDFYKLPTVAGCVPRRI